MVDVSNMVFNGDFDRWHHVSCRAFSHSECRRESQYRFEARITSRRLGPVDYAKTALPESGMKLTRGAREIRLDDRDHFMLLLVREGQVNLALDERTMRAEAGDMILYDQTRPFSMEFQFHQATVLNIPRPLLVSRMPDVDRFMGRVLLRRSPLGGLMRSMIGHMGEFDEATPGNVADRIVASLLDVLVTTVDAEFRQDAVQQQACHRLLPRVEAYMLEHLHDADLDLATIASAMNVAPRTLARAFAAKDATPMRWLWRQRLSAAYRALAEGRVANVTEAALTYGFSDLSHFSRAFKLEFGALPTAIQKTRNLR